MGTGVIFEQVHHGNKRTKIKKANKMLVLTALAGRQSFHICENAFNCYYGRMILIENSIISQHLIDHKSVIRDQIPDFILLRQLLNVDFHKLSASKTN